MSASFLAAATAHTVDADGSPSVGFSSLMEAAEQNQPAAVAALIDAGADVNLKAEDGSTVLYVCAELGDAASVAKLIECGANVDEGKRVDGNGGGSPLVRACLKGHQAAVQLLLAAKADAQFERPDGFTPLAVAVQGGFVDIINDDVVNSY